MRVDNSGTINGQTQRFVNIDARSAGATAWIAAAVVALTCDYAGAQRSTPDVPSPKVSIVDFADLELEAEVNRRGATIRRWAGDAFFAGSRWMVATVYEQRGRDPWTPAPSEGKPARPYGVVKLDLKLNDRQVLRCEEGVIRAFPMTDGQCGVVVQSAAQPLLVAWNLLEDTTKTIGPWPERERVGGQFDLGLVRCEWLNVRSEGESPRWLLSKRGERNGILLEERPFGRVRSSWFTGYGDAPGLLLFQPILNAKRLDPMPRTPFSPTMTVSINPLSEIVWIDLSGRKEAWGARLSDLLRETVKEDAVVRSVTVSKSGVEANAEAIVSVFTDRMALFFEPDLAERALRPRGFLSATDIGERQFSTLSKSGTFYGGDVVVSKSGDTLAFADHDEYVYTVPLREAFAKCDATRVAIAEWSLMHVLVGIDSSGDLVLSNGVEVIIHRAQQSEIVKRLPWGFSR